MARTGQWAAVGPPVVSPGQLICSGVFIAGRLGNRDNGVRAGCSKRKGAIRLKSDFVEAYFNRGNAFMTKGDSDKSIADYTDAIRLNPDFAEAYCGRGSSYGKKGDQEKAIADFTDAVRLKPDFALAYYNRGNAFGKKGEPDKAVTDFTDAIRLNPDYADAYHNRGNAYREKGDLNKAIADETEAIRLKPDDTGAYINRAVVYGVNGDWNKAITDLTDAIRIRPDNAEPYLKRGNAYALKGDLDKAIVDLTEAIRLKPDYVEAYNLRSVAYEAKGDNEKAKKDLARAKQLEGAKEFRTLNAQRWIDLVVRRTGGAESDNGMPEAWGDEIGKLPGISVAMGGLMDLVSFPDKDLTAVFVNGWPADSPLFAELKLRPGGRKPTASDRHKVLVGKLLAAKLGAKVGDRIPFYGEEVGVIGIVDSDEVDDANAISALLSDLQAFMNRPHQVTGFIVRSTIPKDGTPEHQAALAELRRRIEALHPGLAAIPFDY